MFPPASSWLVSTSQLCILSESCSSCPHTQPAHCTSSVNPSAKEHRSSISTVPPPPAGIPPHSHLLHPQTFVSSVADIFSFSIPFSHSLFVSYTHPVHLPGDSILCECKPPHLGTFLPLFLSTTLFLPAFFTERPSLLEFKQRMIRSWQQNLCRFAQNIWKILMTRRKANCPCSKSKCDPVYHSVFLPSWLL